MPGWSLSSAPRDDWRLGEQIARRVLTLYVARFGDLRPLMTPPIGPPMDADLRGLPAVALNALCSRALNQLVVTDRAGGGRKRVEAAHWRVILYVLTSAATLREAIARCGECFEAIDGRCGRLSLESGAEGAEVRLDAALGADLRDDGAVALYSTGEIHRLLSALIGRPLPLRRICVEPADPWLAELDLTQLPCPVSLAAEWTGFVFPSAYLDHPVVCGPEGLNASAGQTFLWQGESVSEPAEPARDRVRRLALRTLREQSRLPSFETVVAEVGLSAATLRRRLAREGTSYREIRDSCRRELGLDLLRRSELSIEELAARLDFCDADAFRRAFHIWFGASPSQYRRHVRAQAVQQTSADGAPDR